MTLIIKKNGIPFPSLLTDIFETDRFLGPGFLDTSAGPIAGDFFYKTPYANIIEREKDYLIELAAPGLSKGDFKVELDDNTICISTENKENKEKKDTGYRCREFSYENFSRSFRLPENSKAEKIEAKYEDGILKIEIPKKEITVSKPKKEIPIS
ncbi:MAG: Hsp20/alpha crystallin family protein [Bacteroidetes bacterium]|nr:Hsp20/alpha crystallin family protein [Bacteroidota bacterium]